MKRILVITALMIFGVAIMSSCHRHGSCPAYGKVDTETVEKNV